MRLQNGKRLAKPSIRSDSLSRRLKRLGATVSSAEGPGVARIGRYVVRYQDPLVLYIELKDIFHRRIYDFSSTRREPRVLDCGSHIGLSILYTKGRHPAARVTCFEPDPHVVLLLEENLRTNGLNDVEVVRAALASGEGTQAFVSERDASHLITDVSESDVMVPTVPLANYLTEEIDFLKLNIEGAELEVLSASRERLGAVRELVLEYHGLERRAQFLHELLELLDAAGFRYLVHDFDAETNPATKPPFRLDDQTRFFLLVYAKRVQ
jgi:FkbM family methyltransferase